MRRDPKATKKLIETIKDSENERLEKESAETAKPPRGESSRAKAMRQLKNALRENARVSAEKLDGAQGNGMDSRACELGEHKSGDDLTRCKICGRMVQDSETTPSLTKH